MSCLPITQLGALRERTRRDRIDAKAAVNVAFDKVVFINAELTEARQLYQAACRAEERAVERDTALRGNSTDSSAGH